jgi:uncharacterized protein YuzE
MDLPRVDVDPDKRYAYIQLGEVGVGGVANSVPLERRDPGDPEALDAIVLDFDGDGRLVGIEITTRCDAVLRPETFRVA